MINKRYIINKKIGEGRSKAFSVIDTEFPERVVAAKFLPISASIEEKQVFKEEYFTLQKLEHPNILKAFELSTVLLKDDEEDLEIEKFSSFITMEYFQSNELLSYSKLNEEKYLKQIIKQLCSVLYYLHQSNYIYYDLKPENILIADVNNEPIIKLIDFGFARRINDNIETSITGTPYYLAPELLKNQPHDNRVDFYSLGILLYRIVYNKFPFEAKSEIEIYKAHIEEEFHFGESKYSSTLIKVLVKLLKKDPVERYQNALQILTDLQIPIDIEITKDFGPAKIFSDRKDAINILGTYLKDKNSNEVFSVNGFDGSGKSSLLQEIYHQNQNSVLIENTKTKTGIDSIKYIFRKLVLTETIFNFKENEYDQIISELYEKPDLVFIETIKRVFNTLPAGIIFTVLLDDYNLYDTFTTETLTEIIRIFQVKGIKVVLSESSDFDQSSTTLNNLCLVQLNQFTEHQLSEFVDLSYSRLFPTEGLKKIILLYSDLLPGSIKQFIKDLILLKVIKYQNASVSFETNEETILTLQSSHEELYRMRLSNLNNRELKLAQMISAFEISIEQTVLSALMDTPADILQNSLNELEKKNIIETLNISNAPKINSYNFSKYIYSTISNRTKFHLILANSIKKLFSDFNIVELSRQYEAANEFEKSAEILSKEIERAEEIHAYSYKKSLLEKLLKLQLSEKVLNKLSVELIKTLFKLSDYKRSLDGLLKIKIDQLPEAEKSELLFIEGSSLIESGKIKEGIDALTNLKTHNISKNLLHKIIISIAYAESDLNNFEQAEEYCLSLLNDTEVSVEDLGRVNNLLAIIEFSFRNNPKKSLEYSFEALKKYESTNLPRRTAGMHINIGAVYDMIGDKIAAEHHWQKALEINSSIGNLEQEGSILINYGVYYEHKNNYEKAIENYGLAKTIFSSTGMKSNMALSIFNLGEVLLKTSDYQSAYDNLNHSLDMFSKLDNSEDKLSVLFTLGKLWHLVGNDEELNNIIYNYEVSAVYDEEKFLKREVNLSYLRLHYNILSGSQLIHENEILQLLEKCLATEENNLYLEIVYNYSEFLIKENKLKKAFDLLNLEKIDKIIEQNIILSAQRFYLFGKIAQIDQNITEMPAIQCFEKAYELLEGESITELTWKVLFEISNTYFERGNFHKAKQPRMYAYELINLIGDNISNAKIRTAFFNHPERKRALEKLTYIGNQAQLNEYQKS